MPDQGTAVSIGLVMGIVAGVLSATVMRYFLFNPSIDYAVRVILSFLGVCLFIGAPIYLLVYICLHLGLRNAQNSLPVMIFTELIPMVYTIFRLRRTNTWDYDLHGYVPKLQDRGRKHASPTKVEGEDKEQRR